MRCKTWVYGALALLGAVSPLVAGAATQVAVASNFLLPAQALAQAYRQQTGHEVLISSGSTGKLYAQVINGAPFAVFLAANEREPQRLEQEGRAVAGSRYTYAVGKLVLWSRDPARLGNDPLALLRQGRFDSLVLANPQTAPYGAAGQQVLDALQPRPSSRQRILRAENVTQAFQYVATGVAELGFVAYSQVLTSAQGGEGGVWLVPPELYTPIRQQAVLLQADDAVARGFLAFLRSSGGRGVILRYGYGVEP